MIYSEIKPFVRFVRIQKTGAEKANPQYFPVDCRLFYVLDGVGKIETEEKTFNMNKGDLLIINSGHTYRQVLGDVTYLAINFDFTFSNSHKTIPIPPVPTDEIKKAYTLENVKFTDIPELNSYFYRSNMFSVKKNLLNMLEEYSKKLPLSDVVCSSVMSLVLSETVRGFSKKSDGTKKLNIEEIVSYIGEHYNENITNRELSDVFHFHANYINEVFKIRLGKSIHQYIMEQRISNAISMLESGNMSISQIASETGFYDSSYFSRYFKKVTGRSPKSYR